MRANRNNCETKSGSRRRELAANACSFERPQTHDPDISTLEKTGHFYFALT
jgi:hypothetical protein